MEPTLDSISTPGSLSRREWLERVSVPALAAAVGAGLASTAVAQPASAAAATPDEALDRGARVYDIRDFGAKGDGTTLNTKAVQAAIDACHRDQGGKVLVPAGDFVVGTLALKSNVTLHLSTKGRLLGSERRDDYWAGEGVPPGNGNLVLLYAVEAENITIEGRGSINGRGGAFFTGHGDATSPAAVRHQDPDAVKPNVDRPHMLIFFRCENVRLRDVFLTEAAYHGIRFLRSRHIQCDGVRIYNRVNHNNDGFHFNSCEYVRISNCEIRCQDDACALFGSNKFVTITNCAFSTRWSIFRFGSGESQNIAVSNCLIYETYGCPVKISSGRARIENLTFSNIVMRDVTGPIGIGFTGRGSQGGRQAAPEDGPSYLRNISFNGLRASVVREPVQHADLGFPPSIYPGEQHSCITLNGVGDAWLENISFTDVQVTYAGGGSAELAAKRDVPQMAAEYFGVWNTDPVGPPAYGLYARNVRGLTLHNVRFEHEQPDLRPAVIFDHVRDVSVVGLSVQSNPQAESVLRVIDSQDVLLAACRVLTPAATFLRVEGAANEGIVVDGGDLRKAKDPLTLADGAERGAVTLRT